MLENASQVIINVILTLGVFFGYFLISRLALRRITQSLYRQQGHAHLVRQLFRIFLTVLLCIVLGFIWFSAQIGNVWITLTSLLGLLAIGFFAVWSVLSNIVCGIILILLRNIEIGDNVTVVEANVSGTIIQINLFYVVLSTKKGTYHIPNNIFIQKIVFKRE